MSKKHPKHNAPSTGATPEAATGTMEPPETVEPESIMEASGETAPKSAKDSAAVLERTAEPAEGFSEAIREGADDARAAAAGVIPEVGELIHKGVYNGFYYLTYGIVFGSLVVGSLIPSNNAMSDGVRDGIKAARRDFEGKEEAGGGHAAEATPSEEGLSPA
jgi:hypothetical protein